MAVKLYFTHKFYILKEKSFIIIEFRKNTNNANNTNTNNTNTNNTNMMLLFVCNTTCWNTIPPISKLHECHAMENFTECSKHSVLTALGKVN